jgi:hypothetical protein
MPASHRAVVVVLLALVLGMAGSGRSAAQAPALAPTPTIGVLTTLTVNGDVPRADIMKVMPNEVRDTVKLYLDGKIQQWWARGDGRGVVFILNCASVAEAKALTDTLPLSRANYATFEYVALTPLTPLRLLIAEPPSAPKP